jgi:hypothetical protein
MRQSRNHTRLLHRLCLGLGAACALTFGTVTAGAQQVPFEGSIFVNQGLVGVARVPSNAVDRFGDTLGGFGSGMTVEPGSWKEQRQGVYGGRFLMLPDRGWNTQGTVNYFGRLQQFDVTLQPFYGASTTRQDQLKMHYRTAVPFHDRWSPTTGLDPVSERPAHNGLPPLPQASNGRIPVDDEGVVEVGDGTIWVSDEYGPYVYHYDKRGELLGAIRPPEAFIPKRLDSNGHPVDDFSANSPPIGVTYNPSKGNPVSGRQNNQGFEGLAISPDHRKLFILLQSALIQDLNTADIKHTRRNTRLMAYDIGHGKPELVGEYVVQLPNFGALLVAAQSEMLALNDHQFLVLARDSGAGFSLASDTSLYRSVDVIDIADPAHPATNIANTQYDSPGHPVAPNGVLDPSITPVAYRKFLDLNDNSQLNRFGLHNGAPNNPNDLYEKWESMAVLPVFDKRKPRDYFLVIGSDNDFITQDGHMVGQPYSDASGANVDTLLLVYRVTLPTYVAPSRHAYPALHHHH